MISGQEYCEQGKKVSIIVPCYKVEEYLPRCLDSLMAQTLNEIEVICVNDGSPDRCLDILEDYRRRFPSKIVVIDKANEGVWRGRQDAIKIARGEYIGFVDSDDYVAPSFCESLYSNAVSNDSDISVCGFYRVDIDSDEIISEEMTEKRPSFLVSTNPELLLQLNGAPWNKLFKASLLKGMYDFDDPPKIFDDMMMHLLVFPRANSVSFCSLPLVYYIIRSDSIMTTIDKSKVSSTYSSMLEVKTYYRSCNVSEQMMSFLDAAAFLHMGTSLMFRVSYDESADLKETLRENRAYLNKFFPSWKTGKIISFSCALKNRGPFTKVYLGRLVYKAHLMPLALRLYRFMIHSMGREIKW